MNIILFCFTAFIASCSSQDIKLFEYWFKRLESKMTKIQDTLDGKHNGVLMEVAHGKRVYQSTEHHPHNGAFKAWKAVDGNLATYHHTKIDHMNPYLIIDLGQVYDVKRVDVFNREDCCGPRLHDLGIYIGPSHSNLSQCGYYKGPAENKDHLVFYCKPSRLSRYVKLMINGPGTLHVAEVKVYALQ